MSKKYQSHIIAFVGTIIALILVFLLLWFLHLKYVKPVEDEGIEITLGEVEEGGGVPEISQKVYTPKVYAKPTASPAKAKPSANDLMVQEKDESLAVNKPTETLKEPDVDPELILQQQEREEKARQERERQEQKKREEEAKKAKAVEAAKGLLGSGNSAEGSDGTGKGSGTGSKGDGSDNPITANPPEVNVRGRTCLKCVKPAGKFTELGKVVLKITVDEQGNVAPAVDAGTTISDQKVLQAAKVAAMNSKFSPGEIAIGTITYIFK
ncbi:MAG: hypothetical protein J6R26_01250 [Paludibacteraceae bacterium]|nr:hypothetical protein [Paludibacteraceae bacterium]